MVEYSSAVLDRTYGALAHPIRREMLDALKVGPQRVTELAQPFDVSLAAASKHVRTLEAAALVTRAIHGRDHVLSLQPRPLLAAHDWIDTYRSFWTGRLDALEAYLQDTS